MESTWCRLPLPLWDPPLRLIGRQTRGIGMSRSQRQHCDTNFIATATFTTSQGRRQMILLCDQETDEVRP